MTEETRVALGDVTNVSKKRGISSILGDLLSKSGGGESGKSVVVDEDSSRPKFSKRLCLVVDDLVKENDVNEGGSSFEEISSEEDKISSGDSYEKEFDDGKEEIYFEPGDKAGAIVLDSSCKNDVVVGEEELGLSVLSSEAEKCEPQGVSEGLSECKNLRSFDLRKCANVNQNANQSVGDDLLKSCSCSFCLKAAYIWSDLHYQDIKGRLSVLKKSQKEASNMIQRNGKERPMDFHASLHPDNASQLESRLMSQWRYLFLNMGDILARENNQLQETFLKMKELREECRIDLERASQAPQHNAQ